MHIYTLRMVADAQRAVEHGRSQRIGHAGFGCRRRGFDACFSTLLETRD